MAQFNVFGGTAPVEVLVNGATVKNNGSAIVYYANTQNVRAPNGADTGLFDGSIASGSQVALPGAQWFSVPAGSRASLDVTPSRPAGYVPVTSWVRARFDAQTATQTTLSEAGAGGATGSGGAFGVHYLDPDDYALSGSTPRLRIRMIVVTNAVAPTSDVSVGLYPITPAGGGAAAVTTTLGTVVSGSLTAATSASLTTSVATMTDSGDFAFPAAGMYLIACNIATNMAVSSAVMVRAQLAVRTT